MERRVKNQGLVSLMDVERRKHVTKDTRGRKVLYLMRGKLKHSKEENYHKTHAALAPRISCRFALVKALNIAENNNAPTRSTPIQVTLLWLIGLSALLTPLPKDDPLLGLSLVPSDVLDWDAMEVMRYKA
jgi:hypothetical protein